MSCADKVSRNEYRLLGSSMCNSVGNIFLKQCYETLDTSCARYKGVCFPGDIAIGENANKGHHPLASLEKR